MLTGKDIVIDPNPILRTKCAEVSFPLTEEQQEALTLMRGYIVNSLDDELAKKYDLIPAVGIAAPQIGRSEAMCYIYIKDEENCVDLALINPKIVAYSKEKTYLETGEACLSIKEEHQGYVHRPVYIKVEYFDINGEKQVLEAHDFLAIAIQHEIDHLNGILFYDHINKLNPFFIPSGSYPL